MEEEKIKVFFRERNVEKIKKKLPRKDAPRPQILFLLKFGRGGDVLGFL